MAGERLEHERNDDPLRYCIHCDTHEAADQAERECDIRLRQALDAARAELASRREATVALSNRFAECMEERDTARADRQALVEETRRKALEDAARTVCHNCASRGLAQHIEGMGFYHTGISIQEEGWCRSEKILRLLAQRPAEGGGKGEG